MSIFKFIAEMLVFVAVIAVIARLCERSAAGKQASGKTITTKKIVMAGLFSAISGVLMCLEFPLLFLAPSFYKLDFSEVPVLILSFAYGPVAGVLCQFGKILVKLLLKGSTSAFVGELADFVIGCALILPAGVVYRFLRTKKGAGAACIVGTVSMTVVGALVNAFYLLPTFSQMYGIPLEKIVQMGQAVPLFGKAIRGTGTLVLFCVVPFNLIKGGVTSLVTMLLYKKLSPMLKNTDQK